MIPTYISKAFKAMIRDFTEEENRWSRWACNESFDQSRLNRGNTDCLAIIASGHMAGALIAAAYKQEDDIKAKRFKWVWGNAKDKSDKLIWEFWTTIYAESIKKNVDLVSVELIETYVLKAYGGCASMSMALHVSPSLLEAYGDIVKIAMDALLGRNGEKRSELMSKLVWSTDNARPVSHSKTASMSTIIIKRSNSGSEKLKVNIKLNLFHTQHMPPLPCTVSEEAWRGSPYYLALLIDPE